MSEYDPGNNTGPSGTNPDSGGGHWDGGGGDFDVVTSLQTTISIMAGTIMMNGTVVGVVSPAALNNVGTLGLQINLGTGEVTQKNADGTTSVVGSVNRSPQSIARDGYVGRVTIVPNEQRPGTDLLTGFNPYLGRYCLRLAEFNGDWRNRAHWEWRHQALIEQRRWELESGHWGAEGSGI